MAALPAELQNSCLGQAQLATTSYGSSKSGEERNFSAVGFISGRSIAEANRWLSLTQCGEWRVRERNVDGEAGQQGFSGKVGTTRRLEAVNVSSMMGDVDVSKLTLCPWSRSQEKQSFDQVLSEAAERNQAVMIDWLADWCRKCIYLKPKLEKLAAEYYPDLKFYYVDLNSLPQALIKWAEKMPTVQI